MAGEGKGTVIVPWYATGFRDEGFERRRSRKSLRSRCATARLLRGLPLSATTATVTSSSPSSRATPTGSATGKAPR